jgi:hypothetical protein
MAISAGLLNEGAMQRSYFSGYTERFISVPNSRLSTINIGYEPVSFELLCSRFTTRSFCCIVATIYRPGSEVVTSAFFDDLSETLDRVSGYTEPIYIVGDLNVRLDRGDDPDSRRLTELLDAYGFVVRNNEPTHVLGGLLDIIATRRDLPSPIVNVFDVGLSDHRLLEWSVPASRPATVVVSVVRRPWHLLDVNMLQEIKRSQLCHAGS